MNYIQLIESFLQQAMQQHAVKDRYIEELQKENTELKLELAGRLQVKSQVIPVNAVPSESN